MRPISYSLLARGAVWKSGPTFLRSTLPKSSRQYRETHFSLRFSLKFLYLKNFCCNLQRSSFLLLTSNFRAYHGPTCSSLTTAVEIPANQSLSRSTSYKPSRNRSFTRLRLLILLKVIIYRGVYLTYAYYIVSI